MANDAWCLRNRSVFPYPFGVRPMQVNATSCHASTYNDTPPSGVPGPPLGVEYHHIHPWAFLPKSAFTHIRGCVHRKWLAYCELRECVRVNSLENLESSMRGVRAVALPTPAFLIYRRRPLVLAGLQESARPQPVHHGVPFPTMPVLGVRPPGVVRSISTGVSARCVHWCSRHAPDVFRHQRSK